MKVCNVVVVVVIVVVVFISRRRPNVTRLQQNVL